jgi:hypothetical protein
VYVVRTSEGRDGKRSLESSLTGYLEKYRRLRQVRPKEVRPRTLLKSDIGCGQATRRRQSLSRHYDDWAKPSGQAGVLHKPKSVDCFLVTDIFLHFIFKIDKV